MALIQANRSELTAETYYSYGTVTFTVIPIFLGSFHILQVAVV